VDSGTPRPGTGRATPSAAQGSSRRRKGFLWATGALVAVLLMGTGFMAGYNPRFRRALVGWGDFDLTVVHTNDTWGYLDGCG